MATFHPAWKRRKNRNEEKCREKKEVYCLWLQLKSGADGRKMPFGKGSRQGRDQRL